MSDEKLIGDAYRLATEQFAELGGDVEGALERLAGIAVSIHCWQGEDVGGFERQDAELSGGGIQATGNYPGKARTADELRDDLDMALSLIPGGHRLNLHASEIVKVLEARFIPISLHSQLWAGELIG